MKPRETTDIHFAGYLMALEYSLTGARRDEKKVSFLFELGDQE